MMDKQYQEYPKWVYPAGIKESYAPGEEPYLLLAPEKKPEKVAK